MADEKGLANWVPVAWHASSSDPYYTVEASARMSYYSATAYPTCAIDGTQKLTGGSSGTYSQYLSVYETRRNVPSPLSIEFLANSYDGNHASVKVKIKLDENVTEGNVCYVVLWEDKVGNYRFVERLSPGYEVLTITQANSEQVITRTYTLNAGWSKANLGVSVIVQKLATREILNAGAVKLVEGIAVEPASVGCVKALYR